MNIDIVEERLKEALESDNPQIIKDIVCSSVEFGEGDSVSFEELMGDDYDTARHIISESIKQRKPKLFSFLKENYPDSSGWSTQLQLIQVEYHSVKDYLSGEIDDCNVSELFEVQEGKLVVNKIKLEEIASYVAFDRIGSYSPTAEEGNYPTEVYLADDEEIVLDMDQNMSER